MALVETLFSEYPDGAPADWTDFWGTGDFTAVVESNAAGDIDFGTKWLKYDSTAADRSVLTWDDLGSMSDVCMVAKLRLINTSTNGARFYIRVGGTAADEDSYHLYIASEIIALNKYKDGAATVLVSETFVSGSGLEYWIKFQAIGTAIKAKIWAADSVEPYDWLFEHTDSDIASGAVGVGAYDSGQDFYLDYIGVDSSEIGLPVAYEDDEYFRDARMPTTFHSPTDFSRAMGGYFDLADRKLKGIGIYCSTPHGDQIRVAVYSGGALATGPQGATLLKDFGLTAGADISQWIIITTADDIDIPENAPLWIVIKGDNAAGFEVVHTAFAHYGSFQAARGRCDIESIIGKDPDVAFASTFPAGAASFSNTWFKFRILTEEDLSVAVDASDVESSSEVSSFSLDRVRPIGASNVECLTQVTAGNLETGWLYPPDIPCNTEITVPPFSVKREVVIPDIESSSEITTPSLKISHDLNYLDISSNTEVTAASIYKELFPSDIECSSEVEGASAEWIMIGRMNVTLPMITAEMSGGHGGFLNATLPMMTAEMRGGAHLNATIPMITAEIIGNVGINGTLNATLPMITAEITGRVETLGQLNATIPMIVARITGTAGHVGQLNAVIPMITAQIAGYTDITGQLNATIPMIEAYLTGTNDRFAACDVLRFEEPELE